MLAFGGSKFHLVLIAKDASPFFISQACHYGIAALSICLHAEAWPSLEARAGFTSNRLGIIKIPYKERVFLSHKELF